MSIQNKILEYRLLYLMDNFEYILSLMIQYVSEGIKPGKYTAIDKNLKWKYEE